MSAAQDIPTDEATRPTTAKKSRPFAAIDNPTNSPSYDFDPSFSPSPPPDWSFVRENPSDQPEYASRGRAVRGRSPPSDAPAPLAGRRRGSSDLEDLDSLLLENAHQGGPDWLPDEFERPPPQVTPKKRRVERVVCHDVDEALDFPMQMPMHMPMQMPLELGLEDAAVDMGGPLPDHPDMHDFQNEHHPDAHPDMHPDLSFSYEEELPLPPLPYRHHAMVEGRAHLLGHSHLHHPQEFMHEMDMYEPMPPLVAPRRSPAGTPTTSPSQMPLRRVAISPSMGRHPHYRPQYMNAYVPGIPMPIGNSVYYRRATYAHPSQYRRFINPANLPSSRVRKAYHLSPVPERRQSHGGPFFMTPQIPHHEEEPFSRHTFFAGPDGSPLAGRDLVCFEERAATSVSALDLPLQHQSMDISSRSIERKQMSLPAMKFSGYDEEAVSAILETEDKKNSPSKKVAKQVKEKVAEEIMDGDTEIVHFDTREHISLSIAEDVNWLSEFQSYVRAEFLEIFRANNEDVKFRNTSRKVAFKQLGIRCRFCAHVHPGSRSRRSSAYPSSTAQIYQSFNMMIRDHFPRCESVPAEKMEQFVMLKGRNNQGAADSKHFWSYAAEKLGMIDTEMGIHMDDVTQRAAQVKQPFSTTSSILALSRAPPVLVVQPSDRSNISPFLYELLSRVQRVRLLDCECRSTRKNLKVGLPGFGCRYCCEAGRLGFSRIFPTKRKGLPDKANDMYEHMRRCTLCPPEVKERLEKLRPRPEDVNASAEKAFFDRVWVRLNE